MQHATGSSSMPIKRLPPHTSPLHPMTDKSQRSPDRTASFHIPSWRRPSSPSVQQRWWHGEDLGRRRQREYGQPRSRDAVALRDATVTGALRIHRYVLHPPAPAPATAGGPPHAGLRWQQRRTTSTPTNCSTKCQDSYKVNLFQFSLDIALLYSLFCVLLKDWTLP